MENRKLQLSNHYTLQFDQLARLFDALRSRQEQARIGRAELQEDTGFADRHVQALVGIASAMGLVVPVIQKLTEIGLVVAKHDIFIEQRGSLEWCHYKGAGSFSNLIWFDVFNELVVNEAPMTQTQWTEYFRSRLKDNYSAKSIKRNIRQEVHFLADAYSKQNFRKLELLLKNPDETLQRRRYLEANPHVFAAMLYDFCRSRDTHVIELQELANTPGSPAVVFGLDTEVLRERVEQLHRAGYLRYERSLSLDQLRLKPGYTTVEFLRAYYEQREPVPQESESWEPNSTSSSHSAKQSSHSAKQKPGGRNRRKNND